MSITTMDHQQPWIQLMTPKPFYQFLPTQPAVHCPQPTFHAVDEEGDDKEGDNDQHTLTTPPPLVHNMDDGHDNDDSEASPSCRDILSEVANKVQRPFCSVIKQFQAANGHFIRKSEWNIFQIYFAANMHEVRDQVGDLTGDAKACWKFFKRLLNYKEMLETWRSLQSMEYTGVMLQQRRCAFDHEVKRFSKTAMELTTQHFDMAFILIGNCINKDAALGTVQCTPGLKGLSIDDNELLGIMKSHAYNLALENFSHDYVVEHKNHRDERDTECMADSDEDGDMDGPVEVESKAVHVSADAGRNQIKSYFLGGFKNVKAPLTAKAIAGCQGVLTLPWTHLAKVLSECGVYILGWPFGVEFPDKIKRPPGKKARG
ncbi:hypothetical protein L208DRAFT_1377502 [Tricholoma matsutake]|nr:hypothetical protein L208DRAFT_1377502 [Tricholoma matsutake 945]